MNPTAKPFIPSPSSRSSLITPKQIPLTCTGHTRPVVDVNFSGIINGDEYYLISACKDSKAILRRGKTGDWIGTFDGHKGAVWSSVLSKDATLSITASADFSAKIWANHDGSCLASFPHNHVVRVVDISNDNSHILTAGMECKIRIYDLNQQSQPLRTLEGTSQIKCAIFDGDNGLVFHGDGCQMKIWDMRVADPIGTRTFPADITSLKFSLDQQYIIATAANNVYFYETQSSNLAKEFTLEMPVSSASLHPSKKLFVAGSTSDCWLRTIDWETGRERDVMKGHHGPVWAVSYSPDGELFASGSEDGTVRLWQHNVGTSYGLWAAQ